MRRIAAALMGLLLLGCPKAQATPRPVDVVTSWAADTVRVTGATCAVSEPSVGCRVSWSVSLDGVSQTVSQPAPIGDGATALLTAPVACVPLKVVTVSVSMRAVNRSGQESEPVTASGSATCSDSPPTKPGSITIQIEIRKGGT